MLRSIYVQSQFVALHCWDAAAVDVEFLAAWHRHIFKVRVDLWVTTNDRELEFLQVQRKLNGVLDQWREQKVNKSCEMFCESILEALKPVYPSLFRVAVSEDGENGAVITLMPGDSGPVATF